jgi:hypothetical protein
VSGPTGEAQSIDTASVSVIVRCHLHLAGQTRSLT